MKMTNNKSSTNSKQDIAVEPCSDPGMVVTPDPAAYCSIMMNSAILSTSNIFVNWKDLAVTSCAVLDPSR